MNLPTARTVSALVRTTIGAGNASCTTRTSGVVLVVVTGNADRTQDREVLARAIAAAAIREGWDASRTGEVLTITGAELPDPAEARVSEVEAIADAAEPEEADVPPTADERVTVPIRARELRPGDEVVDSLGNRQYAAFDVQLDDPADPVAVKVWTAIRDQEAGLPPVIVVNARRELLVLRPVSEEGRELLAALDWI